MTKFTHILFSIAFLFLLAACSSSSGGSSSQNLGTPISEDEFLQSMTTGVYRITADMELPDISFEINGSTVNISASAKSQQAISLTVNSTTSAIYDACDLQGPTSSNLSDDVTDPGVPGVTSCTQSYYKVSDTHLQMKYSCTQSDTGTPTEFVVDAVRLSDNPDFNLGSLSLDFSSAAYPDANESTGVCGSMVMSSNVTTITPPLPDQGNSSTSKTSIDLVAPYDTDKRVMLELTFSTDSLVADTYDVEQYPVFTSDRQVTVTVLSAAYGGTAITPETLTATGGTVIIDSVSSLSISGTYNVDVDTGTLSGAFSLDLR